MSIVRSQPQAHPVKATVDEVRHLHQVEHDGESEWTPLIALAGLFLFLLTVYLLVLGTVVAGSHLIGR